MMDRDGLADDEIVCGGPSPASMRGGALVGAFIDHERLELNIHEYGAVDLP